MVGQPGCLFCTEEEPCAAHVSKPKKQSIRKPRGTSPSVSTPTSIPSSSSPTDDWFNAPKQARFQVVEQTPLTTEELELKEAIINLWPILAPREQRRLKDFIHPPRDAKQLNRTVEVRRMLDGNA